MKKEKARVDKSLFKKDDIELQEYLAFRRRGSIVENKKGKGSYKRKKMKFDENNY